MSASTVSSASLPRIPSTDVTDSYSKNLQIPQTWRDQTLTAPHSSICWVSVYLLSETCALLLFFSRHRLVVADSLYSLLPQSPYGLVYSQQIKPTPATSGPGHFHTGTPPSLGHWSLTMTLSGTRRAPVPPLSSRQVIDLGVFSCPDSVTTASPRFRSANCCCSTLRGALSAPSPRAPHASLSRLIVVFCRLPHHQLCM
jgi:hypothetical protein